MPVTGWRNECKSGVVVGGSFNQIAGEVKHDRY
jgi:hypothetical protein